MAVSLIALQIKPGPAKKAGNNRGLLPWATQLTEPRSSPSLQICSLGNLCQIFPGLVSCNPTALKPLSRSRCPRSRGRFLHHYPITLWAAQSCPWWASQQKNTLFSFSFLDTRCWEHPFTQETSSPAAPAEAELRVWPVIPVHLFPPVTKERWLFLRAPVLKVFTHTHNFSSRGRGIYWPCNSPPQQCINNL